MKTYILTVAATLLFAAQSALAVGPCCCFCQKGRCQVEVDVEDVDVKIFDCECEAICIPPLRFPWECGPLKKCGKVRVVKKLVSDKKKCKVCTYDWTAIVCCPDCRSKMNRCGSSCCEPSCCDVPCCDESPCCDSPCFAVPCCATESSQANSVASVPVPSSVTIPGSLTSDETEVTIPEVVIAPVVPQARPSIELVQALQDAEPEADGWVKVPHVATRPLTVDGGLIE